jgi:hypothetical protein
MNFRHGQNGKSMLRVLTTILTAAVSVGPLAGCTSAFVEKLPTELDGLPAGTPAPPAQPYEYPAVHDVPPPRPQPAMSVEQQQKVEDDLRAARDRQERAQAKAAADDKAAAKPAAPGN